ncbi:hypothetical protein bpr_I1882 [Butyrivibrio proteoclasticus B316]|uniref:Uncharacterized protein n=1 Tax=Butyrivibrio proteoclasticus (strain ATCC 51982 / DSM 14932 / B316) TaxID=515622 RepID=E0RWU0_BUTPB|nr:DUF6465 family protein [Butyrivibrio proteoclasticus]ADL34616.1 hypothetical protein bpr_I1882 [Butyrivibrio proteoclasticus B316]
MAAKKTAAPKTTATKKATAPKASTKKSIKDPTVKVVFQYQDVEFTEASCVKKAQAGFKKAFKDVELKTLDIYIKPEERKVYYVGNGEFEGFVDL